MFCVALKHFDVLATLLGMCFLLLKYKKLGRFGSKLIHKLWSLTSYCTVVYTQKN